MFLTNSENFLKKNKINKFSKLKKVFSISTDKAVYPKSILGYTKRMMENRLSQFKKNNQKVFVSTVRFANVSFSNGSILKMIIDRVNRKEKIGIPDMIYRYFITHDEASTLCFKSLLKINDGCILIPNKDILAKQYSIKELCTRILKVKKYNVNYTYTSNSRINKNTYVISLNKDKTDGQKEYEELFEVEEINLNNEKENVHRLIMNYNKIYNYNNKLTKIENIAELNKILKVKLMQQSNEIKNLSKIL
jgi:FlaA1/EpsC-like NDP-sugar epimerase